MNAPTNSTWTLHRAADVGWPRCGYIDYYAAGPCAEPSCHNNGDEVLLCEQHLASAMVIIDQTPQVQA